MREEKAEGYSFNTFGGVFLPSILTILGVVMFMRLGTVVGKLGIGGALGILFFAESIAIATGLSISSVSTNTKVLSGGPYFLISRALGPGFGSSIGLTYYVSQSLSVPFYIIGFTEAVLTVFPHLESYQFFVSLIPLLILFGIALIGANWAIRTQYIIMTILGLSIISIFAGAFAAGPTFSRMQLNMFTSAEQKNDIVSIAFCFAVFFPAVTGFLSGVNMSGDLADARKSIPRGTMSAILAGFLIYVSEIILFGSVWDRVSLTENTYGILLKSAIWHTGFLIFAGVAAATLSSALGTLLGAPRILQAFAADKIFHSLDSFAKGRGKNNDPVQAMLLTLCISVIVIVWGTFSKGNTLNTVAELVTMFTLCTYAIINIAAAVEHYASNPSFRPKFHLYHWIIGYYGALACLIAALFINPAVLLIALAAVGILFAAARRKSLASTFGDARRGYYFENIRRNLRKLASMPENAKNWRPQLLVLAGHDQKHELLIHTGSLLNNERGILSVLRIFLFPGDEVNFERERKKELSLIRFISEKSNTSFFPEVVGIRNEPDFDTALDIFLQSHSCGPLAPNIVLSGWPVREERVHAFFLHLRTIRRLRMNSLLLLNQEQMAGQPNGTIDIWWRGRKNGSLMLILAYLLTCNHDWNHMRIRILRTVSPESGEKAQAELAELVKDARIDAEQVVITDGSDFETAFTRESAGAFVVFIGYVLPNEKDIPEFHHKICHLLNGMPATFLVSSQGDTDLDS